MMYDNQFKFMVNEENENDTTETYGFCPCKNNGCTHGCSNAGIGCFRTCKDNTMFLD